MSRIPKALHLPPPGRPRWVCPESAQLDLLYLAWGHRFYGQHPIPVSRHPGWHYVLVKRGRPTLVFEHHRKTLNPGDFLVIDPDCASGWLDQPDGVSDLLVWIWRTGPRSWDLTVGPGKHRQWAIGARLRQELEDFHAQCRQEVERPDELTNLAIKQVHLGIDITVTRLVRHKTQPPEPSVRMELARRWMAQNLAERNLTSALSEYLQISPATLTRMFQTHHGESPFVHYQRVKVEKARELLKMDRLSVSEVASALGYKHPNDFTRAFRRFVGKNPTAIRRVGSNGRRRSP
jgi:AraC-like DNA-binding protein